MKTRIRKGHGAYMLRQFFKYIFQSIAGMIGISVYILADTFLYQFIQAQMAWQF